MFYTRKNGHLIRPLCKDCHKKELKGITGSYREFKKEICNMCGFTGHRCQLDVNHIDGNHRNNSLKNLETLCANCHRLVSHVQRLERIKLNSNFLTQ